MKLLWAADRRDWASKLRFSLPTTGQGTLEGRLFHVRVRAKTGTLQATVGLAGYLYPDRPDPVIFAAFLNHRPGDAASGRSEIAGLLRQWAKQ